MWRARSDVRPGPSGGAVAAEGAGRAGQVPGKVTRTEQIPSADAQRPSPDTSARGSSQRNRDRAEEWRLDDTLLAALGLGDLGQSEGGSEEPLAAVAADRMVRGRDPVVLYLAIHSNAVAHEIATMLRAHEEEWPAPSAQLEWGDVGRFTRRLVQSLCPVVRDDSFSLFQLVHPLSPEEAYRRQVAGLQATRTTWIPGFGEAVAAQVKAAMFASISRVGERFAQAAAHGNGEPPTASKILTSHPLDSYVRGAMAMEGVLDFSTLWRKGDAIAESSRRSSIKVKWLGREDASLWNYVRVSPPEATAEEVAAALYGHPSQSRMAFALQRHGDLFQVAPRQARDLIASRYPREVIGKGTARDGAALAVSPLGDELALRQAQRFGALDGVQPGTLPELLNLHFVILARLEQLRAVTQPLGLAGKLEPAFAFRARTVIEVTHAEEDVRAVWQQVWHEQDLLLITITAAVTSLAAQEKAAAASSNRHAKALRERIAKYLGAAAVSHLNESCTALLAELTAMSRQDRVDEATDAQIGLRDAWRQAKEAGGERGVGDVDAALTSAQARVLRGDDAASLLAPQLDAEEAALRIRIQMVRLALIDLGEAADEAGAGLSAEIARCCSGKFRRLPAFIDDIQLKLFDVERVWAARERDFAQPLVVADERAESEARTQARAQGLQAAISGFARIAGDRDIGAFLREAQSVVASQQFRSGIVKLTGALLLTVATSGLAAELGAGVAGLIGAGEAGGAATAGVLVARAGGAMVNLAVNSSVNSAVQYAMSEGHESMGWALVENALMELATRGMGKMFQGPMLRLRTLERQAMRDGQRLGELVAMEKRAAREGAAIDEGLVRERQVLQQASMDRAGWFVAGLSVDVVLGMASQWAARSLLQTVRGPGAAINDDFATNVLQQGAAIMLGKRLFALKGAWEARRAELENYPRWAQLPLARSLIERRQAFFEEAKALTHSISPEPDAGAKLLAKHEELLRLEQEVVGKDSAPLAQDAVAKNVSSPPRHVTSVSEDAKVPREPVGREAKKPQEESKGISQRSTSQISAVDPHQAELARIRSGTPGKIRSESELNDADVATSMNAQLCSISVADVREILARFPETQREQARYVLSRSSQYASMDAWNGLRLALETELWRGNALYLPGSGSLADNIAYVSSKHSFDKIEGLERPLVTTKELRPRTFIIMDEVVLHKIQTEPEFAKAITKYSIRMLEPRGFRNGINLYNSPNAEAVATRTAEILHRAFALNADGRITFEKAVDVALSNGTIDTLRAANPALEYNLKEVDIEQYPELSEQAISRQLNGGAGISEGELTEQLSRLSVEQREYARELLAHQSEIFSSRRLARELAEQHKLLVELASRRGISPDKVFFFIPEEGKSYGMLAMAHRQATSTTADRYINGSAELKARKLGKDTALIVLDDVAGSGMSLRDSVEVMLLSYSGEVLVSPMVSTEMARSSIGDGFPGSTNVTFAPRAMSRALEESFFYKNLDPAQQENVSSVAGAKGFARNALSMAFPYMAPDNNNSFFGDLIAKFYILNRNRSAAKSAPYAVGAEKEQGR